MCILSYLPANVAGDEMDLLNGGLANPHGHGWAITHEDTILVGKGMVLENVLDEFVDIRKRFPKGHALFHSRWATHGVTDETNCHPFIVGNNPKTVVAHNGILPCTPAKGDKRSDTRLFADDILSTRYRRLDKPRAFDAMTNFIGRYNKLVILTVDPRYQRNAYLVNEPAGNWDELSGVWHSNYDYMDYGTKYSNGSFAYDSATKTATWVPAARTLGKAMVSMDDMCDMCYGDIGKHGYCRDCGTCEECYETSRDCKCYEAYARAAVASTRDIQSMTETEYEVVFSDC